jgi:hypothetical protein
LEGNQISKVSELAELARLPSLVELNMSGNPLCEEKGEDFKKEVIIAFEEQGQTMLKKINGDEITPEEFEEAMNLKKERIQAAFDKPPEEEKPEGEEAPAEEED